RIPHVLPVNDWHFEPHIVRREVESINTNLLALVRRVAPGRGMKKMDDFALPANFDAGHLIGESISALSLGTQLHHAANIKTRSVQFLNSRRQRREIVAGRVFRSMPGVGETGII